MSTNKRFLVLVAKKDEEKTTVQFMDHQDIQLMLIGRRWGEVVIVPDMQDTLYDLHDVFEYDGYKNTNLATVVMVIEGHIVAPRLELVVPSPHGDLKK